MHFYADVQATRHWWREHDWQCDCCYCENYRRAFFDAFPEGVEALEKLGVSFDHALEICECGWNAGHTARVYQAYYPAKGTLGEDMLLLKGKGSITLYRADSPDLHCPGCGMEAPFFIAEVQIELPWVLEEEA